jgi:hypothetical protein
MKPKSALMVAVFCLASFGAAANERVPVRGIATASHQEIETDDGPLTFDATLRAAPDALGACHFISSFSVAINKQPFQIPATPLLSIRSPRLEAAVIYTVLGDRGSSLFIDIPFGDSYRVVGANAYNNDKSLLRIELDVATRQTLRIVAFDFKSSGRHLERQIWEKAK